ncbi:MarR family transcriptional regulator [Bacillus sp. FJAT-47783]|uniref:MarR family winged helix-turn-helix transcriptional regulator n=1 Tax=Bacillus sp. FJAT-47783 TaxID=2922712 RepID=UPI001FACEE49|nr:MarR family transcriptional regulator [Bacillus sp. FJAT-47783]
MKNSLTSQLIYLNNEVRQIYLSRLSKHFKSYNITYDQWLLLRMVEKNQGVNQKDLADMIKKDRPSTTRLLDNLERKTFIIRKRDEKDRRAFSIFITEEGERLLNKINIHEREYQTILFEDFSEDELKQLIHFFEKMRDNLLLNEK